LYSWAHRLFAEDTRGEKEWVRIMRIAAPVAGLYTKWDHKGIAYESVIEREQGK
jgi:hypothetical protein